MRKREERKGVEMERGNKTKERGGEEMREIRDRVSERNQRMRDTGKTRETKRKRKRRRLRVMKGEKMRE